MYFKIIILSSMTLIASSRMLNEMKTIIDNMKILNDKIISDALNNHDGIHLNKFSNNIIQWLNDKHEVLFGNETPIYTIFSSSEGKIQFKKQTDLMKRILPLLYENYNYATISNIIKRSNNIQHVNSSNRQIKNEQSVMDTIHLKSDQNPENTEKPNTILPVKKTRMLTMTGQSIPEVVYPEILVIVDHSLYKLFEEKMSKMILYLLAFWTGVDLKFRSLVNPKFRLNIAGIIIAKDDDALEYISNSKIKGKIEYAVAINNSRFWLHDQRSIIDINSYDVAVTMTSTELCDARTIIQIYHMEVCLSPILGVSRISGTCQSSGENYVNKTLFVHDVGGFGGIDIAAHELAHSFGVLHDNIENSRCSEHDGFIMASIQMHTSNASDWSLCTLNSLQKFFSDSKLNCLFNKPNPGHNRGGFLPGKLLNSNEQCRKIEKTQVAVIDETICKELKCSKYNQLSEINEKSGAADGTSCGTRKFCLHNQCISENQI